MRPLEQHTKQKQAPPKLDYRSMVSIDDMPTLFVSFDSEYDLIYFIPFYSMAIPFTKCIHANVNHTFHNTLFHIIP